MNGCSRKFYGKIWVGFCLNTGKCFFLEVSTTERAKVLLKISARDFQFLVGSTKIENASFTYKTATSEANVKTTKSTYHKERSFSSNYFFENFVSV